MQQSVEDGGREHLVASEQFGLVADVLVGGYDQGAAVVTLADYAEEQACVLATQRIVAHFVDQQSTLFLHFLSRIGGR